jgi:hypothetical protein
VFYICLVDEMLLLIDGQETNAFRRLFLSVLCLIDGYSIERCHLLFISMRCLIDGCSIGCVLRKLFEYYYM